MQPAENAAASPASQPAIGIAASSTQPSPDPKQLLATILSNYNVSSSTINLNSQPLDGQISFHLPKDFFRFANLLQHNKIPATYETLTLTIGLNIDLTKEQERTNLANMAEQSGPKATMIPLNVPALELRFLLEQLVPQTLYPSVRIKQLDASCCQVSFRTIHEEATFLGWIQSLGVTAKIPEHNELCGPPIIDATLLNIKALYEHYHDNFLLNPYKHNPDYTFAQYSELYAKFSGTDDNDDTSQSVSTQTQPPAPATSQPKPEDTAASPATTTQNFSDVPLTNDFSPKIQQIMQILANRIARTLEKHYECIPTPNTADAANTTHLEKHRLLSDLFCAIAYLSKKPITPEILQSMLALCNKALDPKALPYRILTTETGSVAGIYNSTLGLLFPRYNPGTISDIDACCKILTNALTLDSSKQSTDTAATKSDGSAKSRTYGRWQ